MVVYRLPTTFIFSLAVTSIFKTAILRQCEAVATSEDLDIFHVLFICFIFSFFLSLSFLFVSANRKSWSYKLLAIIGGKENPPKIGPSLLTAFLYIIHVGGLIIGSFLTSPFRAIMLEQYLSIILDRPTKAKNVKNSGFKSLKFLASLLPIVLSMLIDFKQLIETELGEYVKVEILPELGIHPDTKMGTKLERPFFFLAFGYACILFSVIAQRFSYWLVKPAVSNSLSTSSFGRKSVKYQILYFSQVQGLAAFLMLPWIIEASLFVPDFSNFFLYFGLSISMIFLSYGNNRLYQNLSTYQNLPPVNWLASVSGSVIVSVLTSLTASEIKLHFSPMNILLTLVFLLSLIYTRPMGSENLALKSNKPFNGLDVTTSLLNNIEFFLLSIMASQDSRQIFYFLLLNLSYMFVQLTYGFWTNSLGLISDAVHMFFDCVALGVGLFAAVTSKWPKNKTFSYGYSRIEVLSGFSNGIFLALISIFIVLEAIERLLHPPEMNTDRLLLISFLGLVVNLIGILAFNHGHHHGHGHGHCSGHSGAPKNDHTDHGHSHHSAIEHKHENVHKTHISDKHNHTHKHNHAHSSEHSHSHDSHGHGHSHNHDLHDHDHGHSHSHNHNHDSHDHGHSHNHNHDSHDHDCHSDKGHSHDHGHSHGHSHNMEGVFLHILADTLGSVGVIISTLLIKYFGWTGFDPLASIFIAVLIFFSVLPLIKSSLTILLLYVPSDIVSRFKSAAKEVSVSLDGTCRVKDGKVWPNDHESYVATVWVELSPSTNPVLATPIIEKIFFDRIPAIKELTLQFEVLS